MARTPATTFTAIRERLPGLARAAAMVALGLSPGLACKSKQEESCRCAEDCRDGLLCVIESNNATLILQPGECAPNGGVGVCAEDDSVAEGTSGLGDPPIFDDMWTKRDIGADEAAMTGDGDGDATGDGDGDTTGDGDGDTTGDGDGDSTGDGDGDTTGDGDGDTTGDGDGDMVGDGDGDMAGDGDGDMVGDGDGDMAGDGDGDMAGDGDGDMTGDGDGDMAGDGDGDMAGDGDGDPPP